MFLPSLLLTLGTVGVAAVHAGLGSPLGPAFAAEIWALAKTFVAASLALGGAGGYVHVNNRRAWAAVGDGEAAHPTPTPATALPPPHRALRPSAITDTIRRRRTGRLRTVTDEGDAGDKGDTPRQAGGNGGAP